ncbi:hypothetical protein ACFQ7N_39495 [Streptomyces niveus]|uniref:hypothetical protein n=1 Tax=Streptomyces niveus TaxID=193462 RepID=UPI00367A7D15
MLLETTGGRALWREGHSYSPLYGDVPDTLTCPGCRIRNGMPPDSCPGVVRLA